MEDATVSEVTSISELFLEDELGPRLSEVAEIIDAEVERMKFANKRFEARRRLTASPSKEKARPKASPVRSLS